MTKSKRRLVAFKPGWSWWIALYSWAHIVPISAVLVSSGLETNRGHLVAQFGICSMVYSFNFRNFTADMRFILGFRPYSLGF